MVLCQLWLFDARCHAVYVITAVQRNDGRQFDVTEELAREASTFVGFQATHTNQSVSKGTGPVKGRVIEAEFVDKKDRASKK